jgi:uncharacterized protein related to proFAR isomerase
MENKYYNLIREEFLEPAGLINKALSFGCQIKNTGIQTVLLAEMDFLKGKEILYVINKDVIEEIYITEKAIEIIGHPYDLREVMRWFESHTDCDLYIQKYVDLSKPLIDQDLEPLYNLMKSLP